MVGLGLVVGWVLGRTDTSVLLDRFVAWAAPKKGGSFKLYRHDIDGYMERWIWQAPWFSVHVHHFLRGDADDCLHDHPWHFVSCLLSRGYVELLPELQPHQPGFSDTDWPGSPARMRVRRRFSLVFHRATDAHLVLLDGPIWTLVLTSDKVHDWGFYTPTGKVGWKQYPATAGQTSYPRVKPMSRWRTR